MTGECERDAARDVDPRSDPEFERLLGEYLDELNANAFIDPEQVLRDHPCLGPAILEDVQAYVALRSADVSAPLGVLGDYTLRREIGRGGMGVVYDAWQHSLDRRVALKVLPAGIAVDDRAFHRFMREAKTAGRLAHPNVVGVHGMGVEQDTPYYAMEYVEGETLAHVVSELAADRPGPSALAGLTHADQELSLRLARLFADVASGLHHAHTRGVIHRDIKPSNLILDRDGRLRILDFGLAQLEGQDGLTRSGDLLGTPLYMSPEQARRRSIPIDHRTDIYSLGATLYEALTLRPPLRGRDSRDTLTQIAEREPVEPRKLNPRIPRDLETIVLRCLEKRPENRYATAEALAQDLTRFVRGEPVEARQRSPWVKHTRRLWASRRRIGVAAGAIALVATIAILLRGNAALRLELEDVIGAAGDEAWIHVLYDNGREQWVALRDDVSYFKEESGERVVFVDRARNIRRSWSQDAGCVFEDAPARGEAAWRPRSVREYVLESARLASTDSRTETVDDTLDGERVVRFDIYSTDASGAEVLRESLWVDRRSRLPLRVRTRLDRAAREAQGREWITGEFSFPERGPSSLHDLGVPHGLEVVRAATTTTRPPEVQALIESGWAALGRWPERWRAVIWSEQESQAQLIECVGRPIRREGLMPDMSGMRFRHATFWGFRAAENAVAGDVLAWMESRVAKRVHVWSGKTAYTLEMPIFADGEKRPTLRIARGPEGNGIWPTAFQWPYLNLAMPLELVADEEAAAAGLVVLRTAGAGTSRDEFTIDPAHGAMCVRRSSWRWDTEIWRETRRFELGDIRPLEGGAHYAAVRRARDYGDPAQGISPSEHTWRIHVEPLGEQALTDDTFDGTKLLEEAKALGAIIESH